MAEFNCYTCQHRGGVAGSTHISCRHPSTSKATEDPGMQLMAIFASVGRAPPMAVAPKELNIIGDPHGIKNGWFNYPWNFDPLWLRNCDGYKEAQTR